MVRDMNFKFVLPSIHINFDMQTKFEVNQTGWMDGLYGDNRSNYVCFRHTTVLKQSN